MFMAIQRVSRWNQLSEAPRCAHNIAWLLRHRTMQALSNYLQNVVILTYGMISIAAAV